MAESGADPARCEAGHWFRSGYYEHSSADFRCVFCGLEVSKSELEELERPAAPDPET